MNSRRVCAIHQPNLFPRPSTIAKLLAADVWVVLDDVQFNARDYQHRARLAPVGQPMQQQWLTLPVHRPRGRDSTIQEVRLAEPELSAHRLKRMPQQYFGRCPHWPAVARLLDAVAPLVSAGDRLSDVTQTSVSVVLHALGWPGQIVRSSQFTVRAQRSQRLADLTAAVGATEYLCGTGGVKYLDEESFAQLGIDVRYVPAMSVPTPRWNRLSVLGLIAAEGLDRFVDTTTSLV